MNIADQDLQRTLKTGILLRRLLWIGIVVPGLAAPWTFFVLTGAYNSPMPPKAVGMLIVAVAIIVVMIGVAMWRRRREIAAKADDAFIGTLAAGVRAKRRLAERGAEIAERVERRVRGLTP